MNFLKSIALFFMGVGFFVSASLEAGQGKNPAAKSIVPQSTTPLFSVPKATRSDTAPRTIAARKTPGRLDSPASHLHIDSVPVVIKTVTDTSKKLAAAVAADTHRNERTPIIAAVRSAVDTQRIVGTSAQPIAKPEPQQKTPLKKPSRRDHGLGILFDLRFGILLLSVIIIGIWLQFTLKKSNQPAFVTTTRLSIMDKEVQTACRYIEKNYKNPQLSLEIICEALVTGKAFLNALFLQELGLSAEDFITHVRINRARMLLEKDTSLSAETAASETGFEDTGAFADAFNSIVGVSFEHYRESRAQHVA